MVNQISSAKESVSNILDQYRILYSATERPATFRAFAAWLSDALAPHGRSISHQSVKNWADKRYLPDRFIMLQIAQSSQHDLRGDFAQDILAAIDPTLFQPATHIAYEIIYSK